MTATLDIHSMMKGIIRQGYFTGTPAYFINLAGCNLQCSWCPTSEMQVINQGQEKTVSEILASVPKRYEHVVIAGGEPLMQDTIVDLIRGFDGFPTVQIKTNGTYPSLMKELDAQDSSLPFTDVWFTLFCMPRLNQATSQFHIADEVFCYISESSDLELAGYIYDEVINAQACDLWYLYPTSRAMLKPCVDMCLQYPSRYKLIPCPF